MILGSLLIVLGSLQVVFGLTGLVNYYHERKFQKHKVQWEHWHKNEEGEWEKETV